MKASQLSIYRLRLQQMREETLKDFLGVESDLHTLALEREIEYVDRAQAVAWEQILAGLDGRARQLVEEIEAALDRIQAGTFGRCEGCEEPIRKARLDTLPTATRCLRCQEDLEP